MRTLLPALTLPLPDPQARPSRQGIPGGAPHEVVDAMTGLDAPQVPSDQLHRVDGLEAGVGVGVALGCGAWGLVTGAGGLRAGVKGVPGVAWDALGAGRRVGRP